MPAINSSTWRSQKPMVATILPCAAPTLRHSRTRPEARREPVTQRPRKKGARVWRKDIMLQRRNATTTDAVPTVFATAWLASRSARKRGPSFVSTDEMDIFGLNLA
jgi:hypothetical protein